MVDNVAAASLRLNLMVAVLIVCWLTVVLATASIGRCVRATAVRAQYDRHTVRERVPTEGLEGSLGVPPSQLRCALWPKAPRGALDNERLRQWLTAPDPEPCAPDEETPRAFEERPGNPGPFAFV